MPYDNAIVDAAKLIFNQRTGTRVMQRDIQQIINGFKLELFDICGHLPQHERVENNNQTAIQFLNENSEG